MTTIGASTPSAPGRGCSTTKPPWSRWSPARRLRLSARARPFGEAVVDITLEPSGSGTEITMGEDVSAGPARLLPGLLRQVPILVRNRESLRRLALVAERHTEP